MKRMSFIALQAIVALLLFFMTVGCSKEEPINPVDNSRPTLAFSLRVADISIGGTRALNEVDENLVKDVKLLLFDENDKLVEMPDVKLKSGGSTSSVYTIDVKEESYGSAVLIANAEELIDVDLETEYENSDLSKDVILKSLIIESGKWNTAPASEGYIPIPMWGEIGEVKINRGANVTNVITFQMLRMLARINVAVKDGVSFKLEDVRLYNYYDKGAVVPASDSLVEGKAEVKGVTVPEGATKPTNAIKNPYLYKVEKGKTALNNEIYTFEAGAGSGDKYLENTALVIGGKYGDDSKVTYYRVDFTGANGYLALLRNHSYNVNVSSVDGSGQSSPLSAFESLESLLKVEIAVWNDVDIDADLGGSGGEPGSGDGDNGESGEECEGDDCDEEGGGSGDGGGDENNGEDEGSGDDDYTVRSESNSYIVEPHGLIHIPVSRANQSGMGVQLQSVDTYAAELLWQDDISVVSEVFVVDNGSNGRYIGVKAAGKHGNAVVAIKKGETILWSWHIWVTNYKPAEEWMDRNLGAINNTPDNVGSFGLYYQWGRKDPFPGSASTWENGKPRTIYDINEKEVDIPKKATPQTTSGGNNLAIVVANPTTYYTGYDWYGGPDGVRNNTLWGSGTTKSVYDPCPEGYRVPSYTGEDLSVPPWITSFSHGFVEEKYNSKVVGRRNNDKGGFYPLSGSMNSNGAYTEVGTYGKYWSATVHSTANKPCYFILSQSSSPKMDSTNTSIYAGSVRCIRE